MNDYIGRINRYENLITKQMMNEKYFLILIGSIFLLGIMAKALVVAYYKRLSKKSENMASPKSKILRQIKMKFEGAFRLNGVVTNPMLLVRRQLNYGKVGIVPISKLNSITNLCVILIMSLSAYFSWIAYYQTGNDRLAGFFIVAGGFLGFVLEMIQQSINMREIQTELSYEIVDFLQNSVMAKEVRRSNKRTEEVLGEAKENNEEAATKEEEALILNQVIGEFL